jgi:hypothetical protein
MKAISPEDSVLEPELRELCGELTAIERAKTAEKFMRWADQLTRSAVLMDRDLVTRVPQPAVPRGFFLVNLAKWQREKLQRLARATGVDLRAVLNWALTKTRIELEERIRIAELAGVHPRECWKLIAGNNRN